LRASRHALRSGFADCVRSAPWQWGYLYYLLHEVEAIARSEADRMIADWESDVASGLNRLLPFDMDAVLRLSLVYSQQRTAHGGHRTLDIFHVATAVHLQATHFLTFDERQRKLARHAGLGVPL